MFFCYLLECSDGSFYLGLTDDPERRLREHNEGNVGDVHWRVISLGETQTLVLGFVDLSSY